MLEPIIALATAPMKAALSIIRLSGDGVFDIAQKMFSKKIVVENKNRLMYGNIVDENKIIDEVVLLLYKNPYSFTGEDSVEIISHGSMVIVNEIIERAINLGCRYANPGEFTSRAFMNGKMNLIQAEAVNDVINATTSEAKNLALMSLKGKTNELVIPIKSKIADILALIETNIDYPEYEDIETATKEKITKDLGSIITELDEVIQNGFKGNVIKDGVKVAIVGKPNAGKSSLLNALLNENKAIVTAIPGTTRDIVEGTLVIKGVSFYLLDTAGIRESEDIVEKAGIDKSIDAIDKADIVLYVVDPTDKVEDLDLIKKIENKKTIKIYNKSDIFTVKEGISISAINKDVQKVLDVLYNSLNLSEENYTNASVSNIRDLSVLTNIRNALKTAYEENETDSSLDIVSVGLTEAYNNIIILTGESNDTDIAKEIFSRFCVGK